MVIIFMEIRKVLTSDDSLVDNFSFDEQCDCEYVLKERKPLPIKKALVVSVIAISLGIVITGVSNINRSEIHSAVEIENSNWSNFDSLQ